MIDEATFRRESDRALESLKQSLIAAEDDDGTFEFEDNNGVMNIIFENGSSKFVITPTPPSARSGSPPRPPALNSTGPSPPTPSPSQKPAKTSKPLPSDSCANTSRIPPSPFPDVVSRALLKKPTIIAV